MAAVQKRLVLCGWLGGFGKGGVAAQVTEHDDDLAMMAFEDLFVTLRDNGFGELGEETVSADQHAPVHRPVQRPALQDHGSVAPPPRYAGEVRRAIERSRICCFARTRQPRNTRLKHQRKSRSLRFAAANRRSELENGSERAFTNLLAEEYVRPHKLRVEYDRKVRELDYRSTSLACSHYRLDAMSSPEEVVRGDKLCLILHY
jgi:hypothetical protein